jgi:hypothetical protein
MAVNIKSCASVCFLIAVFAVGCDTTSGNNEGDSCSAYVGQPCMCPDNVTGTLQCDANQQPVCVCPQGTSGNGSQTPVDTGAGNGGNPAGAGTSGAGTSGTDQGGSGASGTGTAGTTGTTDAGPPDTAPVGDGATADSSTSNQDSGLPVTGRFPAVNDVWADGPYSPVTVNNTGPGNAYTIFHPQELAPNGVLNPIVTWGNGAMTNPSLYPNLLPHLASHGFVIIAANTTMVAGADLIAGIDWLLEQNQNSSSPFYHKLDPDNVASMGYSMGSLATFDIADDPRLTTTVHISGGARGAANVNNLRQMAAFFCDELETAPNCDPDFNMAQVPIFYGIFLGTNHVGTMLDPYISRVAGATTGWLRWRLMADESQKALFVGAGCGLCTDPNWTVQQKDLI